MLPSRIRCVRVLVIELPELLLDRLLAHVHAAVDSQADGRLFTFIVATSNSMSGTGNSIRKIWKSRLFHEKELRTMARF